MTGPMDMTGTRHSWRHVGDGVTVACRYCGAEPWSTDGRNPCPVTNAGQGYAEQTPTLEPEYLRAGDLYHCDCDDDRCRIVYGIAYGFVEALNEYIAGVHDFDSFGAFMDRVEHYSWESWMRDGMSGPQDVNP